MEDEKLSIIGVLFKEPKSVPFKITFSITPNVRATRVILYDFF